MRGRQAGKPRFGRSLTLPGRFGRSLTLYREGSDRVSPYRDLAMAAEIGWRPAPNGEPGMGIRTPLEAI